MHTVNRWIHIDLKFQFILIAHFLNGEITLYILDFLADEDRFIFVADTLPQKSCQRSGHQYYIFIFLPFRHPDNGIQRIIKKVGIDLGLKSFQFALSLQFLFMDILCHQIFNLMGHHIEWCGKTSNFILGRYNQIICCLEISFLNPFHRITKLLNRKSYASGNKAGNKHGDHNQYNGRHYIYVIGLFTAL